jgi:hypothetical protein
LNLQPPDSRQDFVNGRAEIHSECVLAGLEYFLAAHTPGAKHIVGGQDKNLIEEYTGIGIQAFKNQLNVVVAQQFGLYGKSRLITPKGLANPLEGLFVICGKRILDEFVIQ